MRQCFSGGFTLVEVLVAMFVLAVGAVGAATTQSFVARLREQAALESEAVQLAASLAARMHANPAQMALPDAANPYLQLDYDAAAGDPVAPPAQCFGATDCDSAGMARFDLYETQRLLHAAFPGGRIAVCRDSTVWNAALQAPDWECVSSPSAPIVIKLGWRLRAEAGRPALEAPAAAAFVTLVVPG